MGRTLLSAKGQVVIPQPLRAQLGLKPGDRFEVDVVDGTIVLKPLPNLLDLASAFEGPDSLGDYIIEEHRREVERDEAQYEYFFGRRDEEDAR